MQTTYQVTCKCGHIFPIPARFLNPDEDERTALLKTLEELPCADCIRADVEKTRAFREDLLRIGTVPFIDVTDFRGEPNPPITPKEHTILAWIDRWNRNYPVGTEVLVKKTDTEKVWDPCTHRTTSPAMLLAGKPMVEVSGLGPIDLTRLLPIVT